MAHANPIQGSRHFRRSSSDASAGYTLIELMVILAIVAALSGIGVVSIRSMVDKSGIQFAADEMFGVIQEARMRAIRNKQDCTVTFDPVANQYQVDLNNQVVDLSKYKGNITFRNSPNAADAPPAASLIFTRQGFAQTFGDVYITTTVDNTWYRLRTTYSGITRVNRYVPTTGTWN